MSDGIDTLSAGFLTKAEAHREAHEAVLAAHPDIQSFLDYFSRSRVGDVLQALVFLDWLDERGFDTAGARRCLHPESIRARWQQFRRLHMAGQYGPGDLVVDLLTAARNHQIDAAIDLLFPYHLTAKFNSACGAYTAAKVREDGVLRRLLSPEPGEPGEPA